MPEGHTIHRAARDHRKDLAGERVRVTSPQGRFEAARVVDTTGHARLRSVEAYGKHLFYVFERGRIVHVHLGLFGRFYRRRSPAPAPRDTTRMRIEGSRWTIDLVGPTACDVIGSKEMAAITARLGPDPLRDDADPSPFLAQLARSKQPIGALLLDQSVVCGVGNVYRAEVLHLLRIHPLTPAASISPAKGRAMWRLIVDLLRRGVEEKRIVTTRGGEHGPPADRVHVYGRRTCASCGGDVTRVTLRAREAYYCRACQPLEDSAREARA